jgi:hypothetical protein
MDKKTKSQYYTITLEKALNLLIDSDRCSRLFAESVKSLIEKYKDIKDWNDSPLPDYMDSYLNAKVLKDFMQKKIEQPDDKLVEFAAKNNIKGVLLTANELSLLQSLVNNHEEGKEYMNKTYGFSTMLN